MPSLLPTRGAVIGAAKPWAVVAHDALGANGLFVGQGLDATGHVAAASSAIGALGASAVGEVVEGMLSQCRGSPREVRVRWWEPQ